MSLIDRFPLYEEVVEGNGASFGFSLDSYWSDDTKQLLGEVIEWCKTNCEGKWQFRFRVHSGTITEFRPIVKGGKFVGRAKAGMVPQYQEEFWLSIFLGSDVVKFKLAWM